MFGVIGYMRITGNIKLVAFVTNHGIFVVQHTVNGSSSRFLKVARAGRATKKTCGEGGQDACVSWQRVGG